MKDLSARLKIKPSTLYLWAAQGKIPCQKIHGLIRFDWDEILPWLASFKEEASNLVSHHSAHHPHIPVDALIARAKREVLLPATGKPDQH